MQEKLQEILKPDGALSKIIPNYESREQQLNMLADIVDSFKKNKNAIIEAGTGVGKSMAYLIPSIYWAINRKERVLISTNTINLQEQLLNKDIPLAQKALNSEIKVVLVKGMSNYLCLRKLKEIHLEQHTFNKEEYQQIRHIEDWAELTVDGTLSDLSITPMHSVWEKIGAESDTCSFRKCPYYTQCCFFKARKEAETAHLLISNHSLLFADLAMRGEENDEGLLPDYSRVILDEAHRIEDAATNFFADRVSYLSLVRLIGRIGTDRQGKFSVLRDQIQFHFQKHTPSFISPILARLNIDIPSLRREFLVHITDLFNAVAKFADNDKEEIKSKMRLQENHFAHPEWNSSIVPAASRAIDSGKRFLLSSKQIIQDLAAVDDKHFQEKIESHASDIKALLFRLETMIQLIEQILQADCSPNKVKWIETHSLKTSTNVHLIEAPLEIGKLMADNLFNAFGTTVLTSATLATNQNFIFFRRRIGLTESLLDDQEVIESKYLSPFDYPRQAKLFIPADIPDPQSPEFFNQAVIGIWEAIKASRGNAFVLFTSYAMMEKCAKILENELKKHKFPLFKQGSSNRKQTLEQFKNTNYSVLFGTDSFWEGVDVSGESLRSVILVKLPFRVPSEPLIQARTEFMKSHGEDPFQNYHLPTAIVKFKQGFGRLIRHKQDRGCIVCLDSRLVNRPYGQHFLNSLPPCQKSIIPLKLIKQEMQRFYKSFK